VLTALLINGSKIWTTHAHMANRMFALVRTGEGETRKQDGISFLLIDMATPGITVRPIRSASGDHEVNQVFFDEVRVRSPLGDERLDLARSSAAPLASAKCARCSVSDLAQSNATSTHRATTSG
jgi:acyl-CoA dehydrogenase